MTGVDRKTNRNSLLDTGPPRYGSRPPRPSAGETLGLSEMGAGGEPHREQAATESRPSADVLADLLEREVEARRTRDLRTRRRGVPLASPTTRDQGDVSVQPRIDERQIQDLQTLRFVPEACTVIVLGPPGGGKTHLSAALAPEAIHVGWGTFVLPAHDGVTDLGRAAHTGVVSTG